MTNGAATFSVQKEPSGTRCNFVLRRYQKNIALECEVCCGVNFALRIKYFQQFVNLENLEFEMIETRL